jgi:hypothetical protein
MCADWEDFGGDEGEEEDLRMILWEYLMFFIWGWVGIG